MTVILFWREDGTSMGSRVSMAHARGACYHLLPCLRNNEEQDSMIWQLRQLEKLSQMEPQLVTAALEELLRRQHSLRDNLVIGAYLDGEISLAKAAEILEKHLVQLQKTFLEKGIPVRLGAESKEELSAEAAAARAMREGSTAT
jgi:predicted HTH domain antitoxin